MSYIAHDVAELDFLYYDENNVETNNLLEVAAVEMVIVVDSGVAVREEKIYCGLRNKNLGLLVPPWDFDSERDSQILK
jgi:hypothetical protein